MNMSNRTRMESGHASRWQVTGRLLFSRVFSRVFSGAIRASLIGVAIGISAATLKPVWAEPPATITYRTSWLGNTYGIPGQHVMQDIKNLAITPDGKVARN